MRLTSLLRPRRSSTRRLACRRPILEPLEGRTVLSQVSLTVTSLADSGPGTLRAAISAADAGSTKANYAIGFAVTGTIDLQTPLPDLHNTIAIQGPGASSLTVERAAGASFASAIVTVDAGQTTNLYGLTVANGSAGGIASNGTLTVANSAVLNNANHYWGGGIYNGPSGTLTVTGSVIAGNSAAGGGGIYDLAGNLSISGSVIAGNTAQSPGGAYGGGGIWMADGGGLSIDGSTISDNTADGPGGGIFGWFTSNSTISNSSIDGNSASPAGGGIYLSASGYTLTVSGSTLSGNSATARVANGTVFNPPGGGGAIYSEGLLNVSGCTLTGNTATGVDYSGTHYSSEGGGIASLLGSTTVQGSTFGGSTPALANSADLGGAIYNRATLYIARSTFTGNTATDSGGALYNALWGSGYGGSATVDTSAFGQNTAVQGGAIDNEFDMTVSASSFMGNTATDGGALYNGAAAPETLTVSGATFTGNSATDSGGGLYNIGTATLNACSLSGNTAGSRGGGIFNGTGAVLTLDNSAVTGDIAPIGADLDDLGTTTLNHSTVGVIGH